MKCLVLRIVEYIEVNYSTWSMDGVWFPYVGASEVCWWATSSWGTSSTLPREAWTIRGCSHRTSYLRGGYCHGAEQTRRCIGILVEIQEWCGRNCVIEWRRRWEPRRTQCNGGKIIWYDRGCGLKCCDIGQCGVVVLIRNCVGGV